MNSNILIFPFVTAGTISEAGFYPSAAGSMVLFGAAVAAKRLWYVEELLFYVLVEDLRSYVLMSRSFIAGGSVCTYPNGPIVSDLVDFNYLLFATSFPLILRMQCTVKYEAKYTQISNDMALVSEIAYLAEHTYCAIDSRDATGTSPQMSGTLNAESFASESDEASDAALASESNDYQYHVLNSSQRGFIRKNLESWEEPTQTKSPPVSRENFFFCLRLDSSLLTSGVYRNCLYIRLIHQSKTFFCFGKKLPQWTTTTHSAGILDWVILVKTASSQPSNCIAAL